MNTILELARRRVERDGWVFAACLVVAACDQRGEDLLETGADQSNFPATPERWEVDATVLTDAEAVTSACLDSGRFIDAGHVVERPSNPLSKGSGSNREGARCFNRAAGECGRGL